MKTYEETMRILEAYDLTGSLRGAAELVGCDHHTVARCLAARDAGRLAGEAKPRDHVIDGYRDKIEEWVERSRGRIRGDIVHERLTALGYGGSERTTRRAVSEAKQLRRRGRGRVYRPWITEPGMWFQYDFGSGPRVGARATLLFCAWLAWSRFRVVLPIWDKALPTVIACVDTSLRRFGGVPTYALTDNEKTVSVDHVAGIPIRHPGVLRAFHHYGLTVVTCVPADPETKGGSEATVRIAKADLVPTEANLLPGYDTFAQLEAACESLCDEVNARPHSVTRRPPAEMLLEEQPRLHRLPSEPYTLAYGSSRTVGETMPLVRHDCGQYSVPAELRGQEVWVREHGEEIVIVQVAATRAVEVARHERTTPGVPRINPAHFPPEPPGSLARQPAATTPAEAEFLALGRGAHLWLTEAGASGVQRVRAQMSHAVELSRLVGAALVDEALGHAAAVGRFAEGDLESIVRHRAASSDDARRASEAATLQGSTSAWDGFGQ